MKNNFVLKWLIDGFYIFLDYIFITESNFKYYFNLYLKITVIQIPFMTLKTISKVRRLREDHTHIGLRILFALTQKGTFTFLNMHFDLKLN